MSTNREVKQWITIDGNHVPIYKGETKQDAFNRSVAMMNENKKKADIAKAKEQADALNNPSKIKDKIKLPTNIDKKFNDDIVSVAESMHSEFPEAEEVKLVKVGNAYDMGTEGVIASMNGLGMLQIREDLLRNYDSTQALCKEQSRDGYLAGDGTFENTILAHEFAHNLDNELSGVVMNHTPKKEEGRKVEIKDENKLKYFTMRGYKSLKVGDTFEFPEIDAEKPFIQIDGKSLSYNDLAGNISEWIVPMAIMNVQENWETLGFRKKPTPGQLISKLSGYVYGGISKDFNAEVFAESYASHKSFGNDANVLAQEVMRLTKQVYNLVVVHENNGVKDFYAKMIGD